MYVAACSFNMDSMTKHQLTAKYVSMLCVWLTNMYDYSVQISLGSVHFLNVISFWKGNLCTKQSSGPAYWLERLTQEQTEVPPPRE